MEGKKSVNTYIFNFKSFNFLLNGTNISAINVKTICLIHLLYIFKSTLEYF